MIWRMRNSIAGLLLLLPLLLLLLLVLLASPSNANKEERRRFEEDMYFFMDYDMEVPTTSTVVPLHQSGSRAPPAYGKIAELDFTSTFIPMSQEEMERNSDIVQTTQAPTIGEPEDEAEAEDDDYNVVVLDDEVPWDLTEDAPEVPNVSNTEIEKATTIPPTQVDPDVTDDDYIIIILEDDVPWDDVAVAEYAKDEFEAISNANANSNSSIDELDYDGDDYQDGYVDEYIDKYPALTPIVTSSPTGSPKPTPLASSNPTGEPTIAPVFIPTLLPSDYPSSLPTNSPSLIPSASPTSSCRDQDIYRSPINGLTCLQHRDTNCLSWRHVGLNMTELAMLVRSCPTTCKIECGSFQLFSAPVSFRISRVSGFMDPGGVDALMDFSIDFLEGFVRNYIGGRNVAKNSKINVDTNGNRNSRAEDRSESNDNDVKSENEGSENNEDDFLNDDMVEGDIIRFEIENAELTAQNLVEDDSIPIGRSDQEVKGRYRPLRWRNLQDLQRSKQQSSGGESIIKTDEALDVIITFNGFTIGMNPERMSELLVSGIDSIDFTRELQQSRIDFFSEATVSSATETAEEDLFVEVDPVEDDTENNSAFSVVISYMVPIVVIGFALGSLFYHKCYSKGKWVPRYSSARQNAIARAQFGGISATPMAVDARNSIAADTTNHEESSSGRLFNFRGLSSVSFNTIGNTENERKKPTNQVANNESSNMAETAKSAFTRFVTALNLNLAIAKSKNSMDEEGPNEVEEISNASSSRSSGSDENESEQGDRMPIIIDDLVSPMSGDSGKNESVSLDNQQQFKPYTSVLPPMIVIDNIEGPDDDAMTPTMMATSSTTGKSNGLPDSTVRSSNKPLDELDAFASEFRKHLNLNSSTSFNARHQSYTGSVYGMHSSSVLDLGPGQDSPKFSPNENADDDYRLIKGMVSEEWDGDDLFSAIPSNITTNDGEDENEEDFLPNPEQTSSSSGSDDEDPLTLPINTPIETAYKLRNYGTWDGSPPSSEAAQNLDSKLSSSFMPAVLHRGTKSDMALPKSRATLPPKRPPTPERGSGILRPVGSEQQHRRSSFPKITPIAQALIGNSGSSTGSEGHRRKSSSDTAPELPKNSSSVSALSTDDLIIDGSKSDGSNANSSRLEFEAPRKGNWGLVLESSSKNGPRIYAVKDYSPLFGMVQKGDKLLEIDGKNVSQSNLADVTKLLKGKSSSYPYHRPVSSSMPIIVSRSSISGVDSSAAPTSLHYYNNSTSSGNDRHHRNQQYSDYNHKRNNSYSSYGSGGSSGSRVVEDVDDDNNNNNNNAVYYLDHHHEQQNHPQHHSSFDYDSSNEI